MSKLNTESIPYFWIKKNEKLAILVVYGVPQFLQIIIILFLYGTYARYLV